MQHVCRKNHYNGNPHLSARRMRSPLALIVVLAVTYMLLGCGGGGGGGSSEGPPDPGPDSTVRTFVGSLNTETVEALPFAFADGAVFHAALSGEAVTVTLDTITDTVITVTLSTADHLARGEIILDTCDFDDVFRDSGCLYPVTITDSDFDAGTGPQIGEILMLEDWLLTARVFNQTSQVTVSLTVEDNAGTASTSEQFEVDGGQLCPWVCAGS